MQLFPRISTFAALGFLSACSLSEQVSVSAVDYNRAVANSTDQVLLLNIVRAAKGLPLHFTRIGQIRGSFEASANIEAQFPFGGQVGDADAVSTVKPSAGVKTAPSFDIQPLNGKAFWEGLSRPLTLAQMAYFWDQGVSKSLLIHLFVESAVISMDDQVCSVESYPPSPDTFTKFDAFAAAFAELRPTPKTKKTSKKSNALSPRALASLAGLQGLKEAGLDVAIDERGDLRFVTSSNTVEFVIPAKVGKGARQDSAVFSLSLDQPENTAKSKSKRGDAAKDKKLARVARCEGKQVTKLVALAKVAAKKSDPANTVNLPKNFQAALKMRSVAGIFVYLGELSQASWKGTARSALDYKSNGSVVEKPIFTLKQGAGQISVAHENAVFSISQAEHDRSLLVLSLLNQLYNLQIEGAEFRPTAAVEFLN